MFAAAAYPLHDDPLARVLGYIDLRAQLIAGQPAEFSCVVGTMSQEVFQTHPRVRAACLVSISGHARTLEADIAAALAERRIDARITAGSLALHTQAVLQGAFILAKAGNDPAAAKDSVGHLRCYFELLFNTHPTRETHS